MRDVGKIAIALLVVGMFIGLVSIAPTVSAHASPFYTIMLRPDDWSEEIQPPIAYIMQNDSAVWRNVDNFNDERNESSLYHRIMIDMDGDGVYNGTEDIDSGELYYECGANSTDDCIVMYTLTFNNSVMGGDVETCSSVDCVSENVYGYVDKVYYEDGNITTRQGAVVVSPHVDAGIVEEEIPEEDNALLMIAIASGAGAIYIGSSLVKKDEE